MASNAVYYILQHKRHNIDRLPDYHCKLEFFIIINNAMKQVIMLCNRCQVAMEQLMWTVNSGCVCSHLIIHFGKLKVSR